MPRSDLFGAAGVLALLAALPARAAEPEGGGKRLSEVVVTAAPYTVSIGSTTTSINVIKRDDLDRAPPAGLGDVLASVPGVRTSFFGPGASRPVIRGLAGPRVLVLTNGIGLIDASALSPDHQVASDPQAAERIEVLRGPSALAYGGSAIGGVVNVIDDRIPSTHRAGLHGRGAYSYATVNDGAQVSGALRAGVGDYWTLTLDGVHRHTGDYDVPTNPISNRRRAAEGLPAPQRPENKVGNTFVNLDEYGGGFSYAADGGWGGLSAKHTDSSYGSAAEGDVFIKLKQTRIDARGGADVNLGLFDKIKFTSGWADYEHTEFEDDAPGTTFLSDGYEGRLELVQPERGGWQGAFGVQGLHRKVDATGDEALIPKTKIAEVGVFTLQRLDKGAWGVEGGLRLDSRKLDSLAGERDFANLSASVGVFARPVDGWFLGLSASRTSRAPTEEELFSNGPHRATGQFEIGEAALREEVSYSANGSLHYSGGRWLLDADIYAAKYDNFIDLRPSGAVDADSDLPIFRFVQSGARFHGAEVEASYRLWRKDARSFRLELAGDYVRGQTDAGPAVRIPPWSVSVRGIYEANVWNGSLEVRTVGAQNRVAEFEAPTDGFTLVNAAVTYTPISGRRALKLFVEGHNLTDQEAREHASALKDVAPLPGRSLRVGVAYDF